MAKRTLVPLLALFALAGVPLRADAPQDEMAVSLSCKAPSFKTRRPTVPFNGSCPLPSGVVVRLQLHRIIETLSAGSLEATTLSAGGGNTDIEDKKFTFNTVLEAPGKYLALISIPIDLQEKDHAQEVQKKTANRQQWQFEFLVWTDDLVPLVSSKLLELNAIVSETRDLLKRCEAACGSEASWLAASKALVAEGTKLNTRVLNSDLRSYYPAAMNNLIFTLRNVLGSAPYYTFGADGKFSGAKDYHADNKKVSTFRNEEFSWDNLKRYVEETLPCAGREFSLWIVKDLRRTAGTMRNDIQEAIKAQKAAPGVDLYADRLAKATISELDAIEADIRGKKR